ncbi:Uma2 family endonuclease [Calycomorphotria hydatis]|uniref:Putative restriction endonuclease domain-containing protein n=1 Tax=Calycomorphotria hydatis TaxID=2528027 RepID=A0A517TD52_9PLAN|nr:Uma2 family endonuclease [Calycomorphotria hydatis]QDT66296.1 hypothetical protein V22_35610 [Calycomorphotria hydatis]
MSLKSTLLTADEFAAQRPSLPDGNWTELVQGAVATLYPPEPVHGTVVMNLSKAIAEMVRPEESIEKVACFDLGICTETSPDTVRFPAVSIFEGVSPFELTDQTLTSMTPLSVMHVASDASRRANCAERVVEFHQAGVREVWIIDPNEQAVTLLETTQPPRVFREGQRIGGDVWPELELLVDDLFAEPGWYR